MKRVWMLDYLNALMPRYGVFETEEDAYAWIENYDPKRKQNYKVFWMEVNGGTLTVGNSSPHNSYVRMR